VTRTKLLPKQSTGRNLNVSTDRTRASEKNHWLERFADRSEVATKRRTAGDPAATRADTGTRKCTGRGKSVGVSPLRVRERALEGGSRRVEGGDGWSTSGGSCRSRVALGSAHREHRLFHVLVRERGGLMVTFVEGPAGTRSPVALSRDVGDLAMLRTDVGRCAPDTAARARC
jgi:hypothetical protein